MLVNNDIPDFTDLDLGASFSLSEWIMRTANVNNPFHTAPPLRSAYCAEEVVCDILIP